MAAVSGVRYAQGIARPFYPLRSTLTPDTAAKAPASRFNRAPLVAARHAIHLDDALRTNVLAFDLACKMEHSCSRIKVIMG